MSELQKITTEQMDAVGVVSAPDVLSGTPSENKSIFDKMVRQLIAPAYNQAVDAINSIEQTETGIQAAEAERVQAETERQKAEAERARAEAERVEAEANREEAVTGYVQQATHSAALAESWAVGGTGIRIGEDTNNAKYWAQQAQHAAGGGVTSFANRSGVVVPQAGDYTAEMVEAADRQLSNLSDYQMALYNIGGKPRKNLLRNSDFSSPLNQRGQASYSGAGTYSIDGWYRGYDTSAVLTLENGYIQFLGSENAELLQRIDGSLHLGRIMTASVLLSDNTMFWATAAMPSAYDGGYLNTDLLKTIPNTGGAAIGLSYYDGRLRYIFICPAGSVVKPVAAKLEEGPGQTLAYKDSGGIWRKYETQDYGSALLAGQYYYAEDTTQVMSNADGKAVIHLPRQMRVVPTCSVDVGVFSAATKNTITVSGLTANRIAAIHYTASAEL